MPYPLGTASCTASPCAKSVLHEDAYFNELWERIYPPSYLEPLKELGPGYEILLGYAKLFARLSLAVARTDCGSHIVDSFGGALANGFVVFSRQTASAGDTVIRAGTIVGTSNGGRRYLTVNDVPFTAGDLGPLQVQVVALTPGWEHNVVGQSTTATGVVLPGEVDTIVTLDAYLVSTGERFFNNPAFSVDNETPICGGQPPMLDGLGADRGISRNSGEGDPSYKNRIRALPDTVSGPAIRRAAQAVFDLYGYTLDYIECWSTAYQTCYDVTGVEPGIDASLFCYDDPRPAWPPFRNRWYGEEDFRGAFVIVVPNIGAISDVGMAFDDTATGPEAISPDTLGLRAISAFDVGPTTPVQQGGYDGFDLGKQAVYSGLYDLLDRIKAAGVFFALELRGE